MANTSLSCFGILHLPSSKFLKLSSENVKQASFSSDHGYSITESSDLYKHSLPSLEKTLLSTSVTQVSCNSSVLAFVTSSGFVLTMGEDKLKSGILGIKNCYSLKSPTKIQITARVSSVHLGHMHGALLSSKGELFTWGTGHSGQLGLALNERQPVTLVQTARIFLIRQVVCGKSFTAFCTAGGFVYVYGNLPVGECEEVRLRQPYTIRGMCEYFIERMECNENFLVTVTDKKEAFVVDACMNLKKIGIDFSRIVCSGDGVLVIEKGDAVIHEFVPEQGAKCKANELVESAYFIDEILNHRFEVFSGSFVSVGIVSDDSPIFEITMQLLSLHKVMIDHTDPAPDGPNPRLKRNLSNLIHILFSCQGNFKQSTFYALKLYSKCKKMALQKPFSLIVAPILTQLMTKSLILKRRAWKKYQAFITHSQKLFHLKALKQSQSITSSLAKVLRKTFNSIIDTFELHEFVRNQKNHFAEQVFSFINKKRLDQKRVGLLGIKKFIQSVRIVKKRLWRVLELVEKSIKLKFVESLIHNHIIKMKIYKTITQIIDYSSAQSSRVRMLKLFHTWKRNLVSIKIALISQKYARSIRNKKMAEKLMQVTRKSYKLGMLSLKNFIRPNFNRFKVIFIVNSLRLILKTSVKPVFVEIKEHNKRLGLLEDYLAPLVKRQFFALIQGMKYLIGRRRTIALFKLLTSLGTRIANQEVLQKFRAFYKFSELNSYHSSPSQSILTESPKLSPTMKLSLTSTCASNTKRKLLVKERASAGATVGEKKVNKKQTPPPRRLKNSTPNKRKSVRIISKGGNTKLQKQVTGVEHEEADDSFISSFTEISPRSAAGTYGDYQKKFVQWEEKIMVLAVAMINSLLKTYLKGYFKGIVKV